MYSRYSNQNVVNIRPEMLNNGQDIISVLRSLESREGIIALILSGCGLTAAHGGLIAQIIKKNRYTLSFLNLSNNDLIDGLIPIFEVLQDAISLSALDIVDNNTGFREAGYLGRLIEERVSLSAIFLGARRSMGNRMLHTSPPDIMAKKCPERAEYFNNMRCYHDSYWPEDYSTGFNEVAMGEARAILAGVEARKKRGIPVTYCYLTSSIRQSTYAVKNEFYEAVRVELLRPRFYLTDNQIYSCDFSVCAANPNSYFFAKYEEEMIEYDKMYEHFKSSF
jgi:hypothetical protein